MSKLFSHRGIVENSKNLFYNNVMSHHESLIEPPPMNTEDALTAIAEIRQRVAAMGANDSEFYSLDQIREKLGNDEIEPAIAVEEARSILSSKEDYH